MAIQILIPTVFRPATSGADLVDVEAATVAEALSRLCERHETLRGRLFREQGKLNRFVNIYRNDEDIRYLGDLDTPLNAGDRLSLVPAVAGG
jgi:molybdopterin converting factor small subunit